MPVSVLTSTVRTRIFPVHLKKILHEIICSCIGCLHLFTLFFCWTAGRAGVMRKLEPCECQVKIDSSFHPRCAYLIVPENRKKNNGKFIKLPFIIVQSKNPEKRKDPLLFTTGGPGGSSLGWADGAARHSLINDRDCIAFEQRGTQYAVPNLWSNELSDAIKESYRKNLNKDSMVIEGVRRYKKAMEARALILAGTIRMKRSRIFMIYSLPCILIRST